MKQYEKPPLGPSVKLPPHFWCYAPEGLFEFFHPNPYGGDPCPYCVRLPDANKN